MKKNILLILMFITMFFIGSNDVFAALECKNNECTVKDIEQDIKSNLETNELVCLYEVKVQNTSSNDLDRVEENTYYSYIYYRPDVDKFYASATKKTFTKYELLPINEDSNWNSNHLISNEAYKELFEKNECPRMSYFDEDKDEVCFDNGGESDCKNNGEKINGQTIFYTKKFKREGSLKQTYSDGFTYANLLNLKISKDMEIPKGYNGVCPYIDLETGDYAILLYNNSTTDLIFNDDGTRMLLKNGETKTFSTIGTKAKTNSYINKVEKINSCPSEIYAKKNAKTAQTGADMQYTFSLDPSSAVSGYVTFKEYKTNIGGEKIDIEDCDDLINEELREIINSIMNIIKIGVPILLIGLITYDFATAVFAGDDKAVNKAKGNAIKRITH